MYRLLFALAFCVISFSGLTQSKDIKTKALNNYVDFTNDCIHGLTISHLMLQSFNNEVNKYVDATDGFVFKNSDFGRDIYSEISYYEHRGKSPMEQYPIMLKEGGVLGADAKVLNELTTKIFDAAKRLNDLRFDAGSFLENNDIQNPENLASIYKKLETGIVLFDQIYSLRNELDRVVSKIATKRALSNQKAKYDKLKATHVTLTKLLHKIRAKETVDFKTYMLKNVTATQGLKTLGNKNTDINDIYTQAVEASKKANRFYTDGSVPKSQVRYGKFYYYYNSIITSYLNTVGSGTAFKTNKYIESEDINQVKFLELPPIFKVLYPRKLVSSDVIVSTDSFIEAIPEKLKERQISASDHTIIVDSQIFELELSDQKLLDGDIVSVSYNGDWILENKSLEKEPVKLKVQLNDRGKNFFTLHAVNEGVVSPNTMEVAYFYKGKKKRVLMESNMKTSQLIEVILE